MEQFRSNREEEKAYDKREERNKHRSPRFRKRTMKVVMFARMGKKGKIEESRAEKD